MRRNSSGQMEPFAARAIATSAPSTTLDATVVVDRLPLLWFGSGASNSVIIGTSWLRLTVK